MKEVIALSELVESGVNSGETVILEILFSRRE
jgi:hypothetical protein